MRGEPNKYSRLDLSDKLSSYLENYLSIFLCRNYAKTAESQELDGFIVTVVDCMVRLEEVPRFVKVKESRQL